MHAGRWLGLIAALLVACAGKSQDSTAMGAGGGGTVNAVSSLRPCDPLAELTTSVPLEASRVVAAGRAQDGSIYVIYGDNRLFVGNDQNLMERIVVGLGETGDQTDLDYTDDDGSPVKVELLHDATTVRMVVARGTQSSKGIDAGNGEVLTLLEPATVAQIGASTTATFTVDFAASLADGRSLVVVAPAHDVDYQQFRVFFGPSSALAQRAVSNFGSSRSGQRLATVTIDGVPADLTYLAGGPSPLNPNGGPTTLTIANTTYELDEATVPDDARYLCFSK
jgi:hypothetical protein